MSENNNIKTHLSCLVSSAKDGCLSTSILNLILLNENVSGYCEEDNIPHNGDCFFHAIIRLINYFQHGTKNLEKQICYQQTESMKLNIANHINSLPIENDFLSDIYKDLETRCRQNNRGRKLPPIDYGQVLVKLVEDLYHYEIKILLLNQKHDGLARFEGVSDNISQSGNNPVIGLVLCQDDNDKDGKYYPIFPIVK
jgi:hypothetical protein